ncbi:GAF domain-containing protein [Streptomyces sp. RB110-1]|uniref:GAF domain-containing protein n=1 Tax=unclassified Streptomyces TaxID=2593676 RepID=UPI0019016343|nr:MULTISPECIES: GAF domain-containing protein [unclassified Streptomyces]MBK0377249.1 GAF domain-containing protein [Streptomyces sp. RB110-1]MBK0386379.1 GAF domain-containing protein [Streptomyces sp. RB110-2]
MLLEAVLDVGSDLELGSTLQQIVDTATALTGARHGALGVLEPDRDRVDALYTTGMTEAERQRIDLFPDTPAGNPALAASGPEAPGPDRAPAPDAVPDRAPAPGPVPTPGPAPVRDHSPAPAPVRDHTPPPAPDPAPDRSPGFPAEGGSLRTPVVVHTEVFGRLHLSGKPSGPFTDIDVALVRALAAQAGIAIGNARLYGAARQRERWIAGAAAVTTALLTGTDAADALMTVAERARVLADASAGVILQPTEEGGMEIVTASTLDDPAGIVGTVIAPGSAVLVQLLGGEPVFIDDSATDPRMTTGVRSRFGPSMMLPLQSGGRLIGTLALPRRRGDRPYTDLDRLLATQFASQAALALVLADAQADREQLAVYEDRDRIARDLHDLVVQRLFATEMMLESTRRRAAAGANGGRGGGEPPAETDEEGTEGGARTGTGAARADGESGDQPSGADAGDLLARAVDELDSTIQEVRTAIFALQQPPAEAPATFRGRVLRETGGAAAVLGFPPSVRFTGAVDALVGEEAARELLAALRGALAAAHRRPGVSAIEVEVDATVRLPDGRAGVRLVVADDGRGEDGRPTTMTWEAPR